MATITAQILIGQAHPNSGGLRYNYKTVQLSENSRPCWILKYGNVDLTLIPERPETILDDGLVFIGIHVLKIPGLRASAIENGINIQDPRTDLTEVTHDSMDPLRKTLLSHYLSHTQSTKLIFSVFDQSSILNQLECLRDYAFDCEILTCQYSRTESVWSGEPGKRFITDRLFQDKSNDPS